MSIAPAPVSAPQRTKGASRVRFHAGQTLAVRVQVVDCEPKLAAKPLDDDAASERLDIVGVVDRQAPRAVSEATSCRPASQQAC